MVVDRLGVGRVADFAGCDRIRLPPTRSPSKPMAPRTDVRLNFRSLWNPPLMASSLGVVLGLVPNAGRS